MATLQGKKTKSSDVSELAKSHEIDRNMLVTRVLNKPLIQFIDEYIIERNAKNKAYYFILEFGYLDEFRKFCK